MLISGPKTVHHFERRAMAHRRMANVLALAADLGKMDGNTRFLVRSSAIALKNDATADETLLAHLKLWMLTTSGLRAAQVDETVFIDLQGFKYRD